MYTFVETPTFVAEAERLWSEDERLEFFAWLASNPEGGDVIPGSGGCRKVEGRNGKEGWRSCHLLHSTGIRRNMAAPHLRQIDPRQHTRSSAQGSTRGD